MSDIQSVRSAFIPTPTYVQAAPKTQAVTPSLPTAASAPSAPPASSFLARFLHTKVVIGAVALLCVIGIGLYYYYYYYRGQKHHTSSDTRTQQTSNSTDNLLSALPTGISQKAKNATDPHRITPKGNPPLRTPSSRVDATATIPAELAPIVHTLVDDPNFTCSEELLRALQK